MTKKERLTLADRFAASERETRFRILSVIIIGKSETASQVEVECIYDGGRYIVTTEIGTGEGLPDCVLNGYTVPPSEEFIVGLHKALGVQAADVVEAVMRRVGG